MEPDLRRQCDSCGSPDATEHGNGHANSCEPCQRTADLAHDARAFGPDPDRATSARRLDEELGIYRSY